LYFCEASSKEEEKSEKKGYPGNGYEIKKVPCVGVKRGRTRQVLKCKRELLHAFNAHVQSEGEEGSVQI